MGSAEEAAITNVVRAYADRLRTGDAKAVAALFTSGTVVLTPGGATIEGREQLAAVYEGHLANVALDFTYQAEQVLADSDLAVVRTTSHGTTTVRASGERSTSRSRELFVLQREDGQ